jgi:hypothetical protein
VYVTVSPAPLATPAPPDTVTAGRSVGSSPSGSPVGGWNTLKEIAPASLKVLTLKLPATGGELTPTLTVTITGLLESPPESCT